MVAIGLLLLLAAGIIAGFALAAGDDPAILNLVGFDVETTDRWLFATGALCALGVLIGLRMIAIGWRRARQRRRELRELRSSVGQTAAPLSDHRRDREHGHRRRGADDDDRDEREYFESTPHD
jgi:hypothetical protein